MYERGRPVTGDAAMASVAFCGDSPKSTAESGGRFPDADDSGMKIAEDRIYLHMSRYLSPGAAILNFSHECADKCAQFGEHLVVGLYGHKILHIDGKN